MQLSSLGADEGAVSPVVGVVLMVGLTVVLAGTVHVFVLDLGDRAMQESPPQAAFAFETDHCDGEKLSIELVGGRTIDADRLSLRSPDLPLSGTWKRPSGYSTTGVADGTVEPGDRATVCIDDPAGVTVTVVWTSESGTESVVLARWSGD